MKLVGSRADGTPDIFSDWDHLIEAADDFHALRSAIDRALVWQLHDAGAFRVLTLVDSEGQLFDYSENTGGFAEQWAAIKALEDEPMLRQYWILAFKHLKAVYRGFFVLLDLGIEMSTGLARDIYLEKRYGAARYKDFFSFKPLAAQLAADETLSRVTGMAYRTKDEKLAKLRALNTMVASLPRGSLGDPLPVFEQRARLVG